MDLSIYFLNIEIDSYYFYRFLPDISPFFVNFCHQQCNCRKIYKSRQSTVYGRLHSERKSFQIFFKMQKQTQAIGRILKKGRRACRRAQLL